MTGKPVNEPKSKGVVWHVTGSLWYMPVLEIGVGGHAITGPPTPILYIYLMMSLRRLLYPRSRGDLSLQGLCGGLNLEKVR
jgi:hypothetical protein